jgi:hypothetical protein
LVWDSLRAGGGAGVLRESLASASGAEWNREIELGVGALPLGLARAVVRFVDVEPEVRAALGAVRGVDVAVYKLARGSRKTEPRQTLSEVDKRMAREGWESLTTVMDGDELVVVYVPKKMRSLRDVRVCVGVLEREELVAVSARANLHALADLGFAQVARHLPRGLPHVLARVD